jgi:hypothetical protein
MLYKVHLAYFRLSGRFLTFADVVINHETLIEIWAEIVELRRIGALPGLRPKAGRDLLILVDVLAHPERQLHLIIPPFVNEEDDTPVRVPTGEMQPLTRATAEDWSAPMVRIPADELPIGRTTTRDVVRPEADDEITPVGLSIPEPVDDK